MQELRPLFDTHGLPVFSIAVALGLAASALLYIHNLKQLEDLKIRKEDSMLYLGISFIFGIALSNFANWFLFSEYENLSIPEKISAAGFTFYFGLIGFVFSLFILFYFMKYPVNKYINTVIPSIVLFHAFGRIGCLLAGCCYGKEGNLNLLFITLLKLPIIEVEIIFLLLLFVLFQRYEFSNRLSKYLILYSLFRFIAEFGRGDNRGKMFTDYLSPSQEISIFLFVFGLSLSKYIKDLKISNPYLKKN